MNQIHKTIRRQKSLYAKLDEIRKIRERFSRLSDTEVNVGLKPSSLNTAAIVERRWEGKQSKNKCNEGSIISEKSKRKRKRLSCLWCGVRGL